MTDHSQVRLTITIADWSVALELAAGDRATRSKIIENYAAFLCQTQSDALVVRISVEPGPVYVPVIPGSVWKIHTDCQDGHIAFESHYEAGWLDMRERRGELTMRPEGNPENFLRVLYAWKCLQNDALLLHACGVLRNARGHVFFGPSGSGKTTIARLSLEHLVLSDDMVIIKKRGETFRVYGVPFRGDFMQAPRTNASADLYGLYTLVKDAEHRLLPLSRTEATARLSACVPFVTGQPTNAERVMDICAELTNNIVTRALHFRPENGFWKVIDGVE
jgi:hypothetical protein